MLEKFDGNVSFCMRVKKINEKFEDSDNNSFISSDIGGFIPKGIKNYKNNPNNRLTDIGERFQNKYIQHGSPNINFVKSFKYMSDEITTDKYNSYIDLSDASISINDYGGLNYKELYKNYV